MKSFVEPLLPGKCRRRQSPSGTPTRLLLFVTMFVACAGTARGQDAASVRAQRAALAVIREHSEIPVPPGVYTIEATSRAHAPTDTEVAGAKEYFLALRATVDRSPRERANGATRLALRADGMPIAMLGLLRGAEFPGRVAESTLELASLEAWMVRGRWRNPDGTEAGPPLHHVRNVHGLWRLEDHPDQREYWVLERVEDTLWAGLPGAAGEMVSFRATVRNLAELTLKGEIPFAPSVGAARGNAVSDPTASEAGRRLTFHLAFDDPSLLHRVYPGMVNIPPGWMELAGTVEVSLHSSGDTDELRLKWNDATDHAVMEETLWSDAATQRPTRFLRQRFLLGGGRVLREYDALFRLVGPLENHADAFAPPPGTPIHDRRDGGFSLRHVAADGTLPTSFQRAAKRAARSEAARDAHTPTEAPLGRTLAVAAASVLVLSVGCGAWLRWRRRGRQRVTPTPIQPST